MTDLSNAIATRTQGQQTQAGPASVEAALARMGPEFQKVLPTFLSPDTFLRLALNELRSTPRLAQCTTQSFMGALMLGARLGLEPGGPLGQLYLTPRNLRVPNTDRKALQVVPIIGYRGLRDLAIRSGRVDSIQSFIVREGDEFRFGSNEDRGVWHEWNPLETDEDESDRPWKGVLTVAQLGVGKKPVWRYLSKKAVLARKGAGDAGDRGPWKDHEEAMVRKTGIRAIANDLPSSSVLIEAVRNDERVNLWRHGDDRPQAQQQLEAPAQEQEVDKTTGEVLEAAPTNATAAQQPTQVQQPARGKKEQYAPPPPGAAPMGGPEEGKS